MTTSKYMSRSNLSKLFMVLCAVILLFAVVFYSNRVISQSIYWGAWISGTTYNLEDAPWSRETINIFEGHAQKQASILHWGQPWWRCYSSCGYQSFQSQVLQYETVRSLGYIPLVDWASWDYSVQPQYDQPDFSLSTIIDGEHDTFIRQWARDARNWGHPFFLRFNWEMNGTWFPWSEKVNGNKPGEFVRAWQHVHDIFRDEGAANVTWVWCPNTIYEDSIPLNELYPGDAYVDWTCIDGYNWGVNPARPDRWKSFSEVFKPTYDYILQIAPSKPIMIGEIASTEYGGSKAEWISDAFTRQLPRNFPQIKAVVWFNWNTDGMDWVIESSRLSQSAFATAIASNYYAENEFADISTSPILPIEHLTWPNWKKVFSASLFTKMLFYGFIILFTTYACYSLYQHARGIKSSVHDT